MSGVLIINAGYEPLQRVSIKHAIRMLVREVAVVDEAVEGQSIGPFPFPKVIRLVRYVVMKWRSAKGPSWSRTRLMIRDGGLCAYCRKPGDTVDHVIPQCEGGKTTWDNTVIACRRCNHKKGRKTVSAAGLTLHVTPSAPTWWELQM